MKRGKNILKKQKIKEVKYWWVKPECLTLIKKPRSVLGFISIKSEQHVVLSCITLRSVLGFISIKSEQHVVLSCIF